MIIEAGKVTVETKGNQGNTKEIPSGKKLP